MGLQTYDRACWPPTQHGEGGEEWKETQDFQNSVCAHEPYQS